MELLFGKYPLILPKGTFPLTCDSVLLAWFAARKGRFCDLGCGGGTLGVLMAIRAGTITDGIEVTDAYLAAEENYRANGLSGKIIHGDVKDAAGSYRYCIFNPPYFKGKPSKKEPVARQDILGSFGDFAGAADRLLISGGEMFFCFPEEGFGEAAEELKSRAFGMKTCVKIHSDEKKAPYLFLCRAQRGEGEMREYHIYLSRNGEHTPEYTRIYGDEKWTWENSTLWERP